MGGDNDECRMRMRDVTIQMPDLHLNFPNFLAVKLTLVFCLAAMKSIGRMIASWCTYSFS